MNSTCTGMSVSTCTSYYATTYDERWLTFSQLTAQSGNATWKTSRLTRPACVLAASDGRERRRQLTAYMASLQGDCTHTISSIYHPHVATECALNM